MNLGLIGVGVVGNAFYEGMKHAFDVIRYDKFRPDLSDVDSIEELVKKTDCPIFVCVPTPMNPDGSASIEIIHDVVNKIALTTSLASRIVVIKSTIPPATVDNLSYVYGEFLGIVFNPEFLTEANPVEDFKNQDRIIIGGRTQTHSNCL